MRTTWTHRVILLFLTLKVVNTDATTCLPHTHYTCVTSNHVTGSCGSDVERMSSSDDVSHCECRDGYVPSMYGCARALQKPYITLEEPTQDTEQHQSYLRFKCAGAELRRTGVVSYTWRLFGEIIHGETKSSYEVMISSGRPGDFIYTCSYHFHGTESPESSPFSFINDHVGSNDVLRFQRLEVKGMPKQISGPTSLRLECSGNYPEERVQGVRWFHNDILIDFKDNHPTPYFDFKVNPSMKGYITCSLQYPNLRTETLSSKPVKLPGLVDNLPDIQISEGSRFVRENTSTSINLTCSSSDPEFVLSDDVVVSWWRNGDVIPNATSRVLTIKHVTTEDEGWYACSARLHRTDFLKFSEPIDVYVGPLKEVIVKSTPEIPVQGGHLVLHCDMPEIFQLSVSSPSTDYATFVDYVWYRNDEELYDHHDRMLRMNDLHFSSPVNFSCKVKIDGLEIRSTVKTFDTTRHFTDTPRPSLSLENPVFTSTRGLYLYNQTYGLLCQGVSIRRSEVQRKTFTGIKLPRKYRRDFGMRHRSLPTSRGQGQAGRRLRNDQVDGRRSSAIGYDSQLHLSHQARIRLQH